MILESGTIVTVAIPWFKALRWKIHRLTCTCCRQKRIATIPKVVRILHYMEGYDAYEVGRVDGGPGVWYLGMEHMK